MFATAQNAAATGVSFAEILKMSSNMRSELAVFPLVFDQEQPIQRICRTFKDRRNFWHLWLIDADDPAAIRCVEWIVDLTACAHAMAEMARRGIELQILTDSIVAAISGIGPLRTDHTFSDWECAARFLNDFEQDI
jgi:hypothetical protein